jgi:pyruvate dehydrogenase E1 component alpha subunit
MKKEKEILNKSSIPGKDVLLKFLEQMYLIRRFEKKVYEFAERGLVFGSVHLCIGEEATAVGVCANLKKEDYIIATHRGHGQVLAKGSDVKKMMAEMIGKETGLCKGRVGSMHVVDKTVNNLGAQGIIGASFPISLGVGLAIKLNHLDRILVTFFGDGSTNQGTFYESLSMADLWKIPVVFICVNNLYGMGTNYSSTCNLEIVEKGKRFNIFSTALNGNDVVEVFLKTKEIIERVRKERCPALVELKTYRQIGHSAFDKHPYRAKEEVEKWKKLDPIYRLEKRLIKNGVDLKEIDSIKEKVDLQIDEAASFAKESKYPEFEKEMES